LLPARLYSPAECFLIANRIFSIIAYRSIDRFIEGGQMKRASLLLMFVAFLGAFPVIFHGLSVLPASAEELKADTNVLIPMDSIAPTQGYPGTGTINSLNIKAGRINLSSEPIASLGWVAQSRDFQVLDRDALANLKPGQKITFELVKLYNGNYIVIKIEPAK